MNKTQLIDALAERYEGNRKAAAHALESVLDTITREVTKGERVAITGFGSFERRVRGERWVRNPRTGERILAQEKAVPRFSPGADLRNVVSGAKLLPELTIAAAVAPVRTAQAAAKTVAVAAKKAGVASTPLSGDGAPASKAPASKAPAKKAPAKKAPAKKASGKKASGSDKKSGATKKTSVSKADSGKKSAAGKTSSKSKKTDSGTKSSKKSASGKKSGKKSSKKS